MAWTIAIFGRPNVGKSTLFNRLCPRAPGRQRALVSPKPGLTRDWREGIARLGNLNFRLIDTAGLERAKSETLEGQMTDGSQNVIPRADLCLFMIDARAGITPADQEWAAYMRKQDGAVLLVANKCESRAGESGWLEAHQLGFGAPIAISAEHGRGLPELESALEALTPEEAREKPEEQGAKHDEPRPLRLAIVGRPNTGKSTLVNTLLGEERVLTGPIPGTTRDAVSIEWRWRNRRLLLFDTAGLRRRARVSEKEEKLSVGSAIEAIRFADVAVLMMEAGAAFEKQDLQIADLIARFGRAPVFAFNKIDLLAVSIPEQRRRIQNLLPQLRGAAVVKMSAANGEGVESLLPACFWAQSIWVRKLSTGRLNQWLQKALRRYPPPAPQGQQIRIKYVTQISASPPEFVLFASRLRVLPETYRRYLVNDLRAHFALWGVPIRLHMRASENPYVSDS